MTFAKFLETFFMEHLWTAASDIAVNIRNEDVNLKFRFYKVTGKMKERY